MGGFTPPVELPAITGLVGGHGTARAILKVATPQKLTADHPW